MFVIAKGVTDISEFDDKDLDSYELEVIGGNHRREAIQPILGKATTNETKELYKFVLSRFIPVSQFHCLFTLWSTLNENCFCKGRIILMQVSEGGREGKGGGFERGHAPFLGRIVTLYET